MSGFRVRISSQDFESGFRVRISIRTSSICVQLLGASLEAESEVFNMSIKHSKGRRMDLFDSFISASLMRRV